MRTAFAICLVTALVLVDLVRCDYGCVCNYNVEKAVYPDKSSTGNPVGYLYEFDCKPEVPGQSADPWKAIAYEHQIGFIEVDPQVETQTCPGIMPDADKCKIF